MNTAAALFRCPATLGVLMAAACTLEPRNVKVVDDAAVSADGMSVVRDASQDTADAATGSDGAGGVAGGRGDASVDSGAEAGGSSGAGGSGGAAGTAGSAGTGGAAGSAGAADAGASGGVGGTSGAAGSGGVAGLGVGGTAGIAGAAGVGAGGGSGGFDAGPGGAAGQTGIDASDVKLVDAYRVDAPDGGLVVLFEETFNSGLGAFTVVNGCKAPPQWSNGGGYARAEAPQYLGSSSIVSPTITIPANVSNIRLRLLHQVVTQEGHDGAQILISKNGETPTVVTSFTQNGYVHGAIVNPDTCAEEQPGDFPAWSGDLMEEEAEANLSAAPLDVGPGDSVSVRLRIAVDSSFAMGGWDIEWVRLTGTAQ